jgi:hypothetical protein
MILASPEGPERWWLFPDSLWVITAVLFVMFLQFPKMATDGKKYAPGVRLSLRSSTHLLALTLFQHLIDGFRNHDLRKQVADLLGVMMADYTSNQMTYDLRRLRLKGLVLPATRDPSLLRYSLRLESRPAVLTFGGASLPARDGDVYRQ